MGQAVKMRLPMQHKTITIVGTGAAGLTCAQACVERGAQVHVIEQADGINAQSCSWWAGGMLAPWCEAATVHGAVKRLGQQALTFWRQHSDHVLHKGTLVLALAHDQAYLRQFAQRTSHYQKIEQQKIGQLEPDFSRAFLARAVFP